VTDLQQSQSDNEIASHEKFLASHGPDAADYSARAEALALAKKQRAELSIADARKSPDR